MDTICQRMVVQIHNTKFVIVNIINKNKNKSSIGSSLLFKIKLYKSFKSILEILKYHKKRYFHSWNIAFENFLLSTQNSCQNKRLFHNHFYFNLLNMLITRIIMFKKSDCKGSRNKFLNGWKKKRSDMILIDVIFPSFHLKKVILSKDCRWIAELGWMGTLILKSLRLAPIIQNK